MNIRNDFTESLECAAVWARSEHEKLQVIATAGNAAWHLVPFEYKSLF